MNEIDFEAAKALVLAKKSRLNKVLLEELEAFAELTNIVLHEGDTELPTLLIGESIVIVNGNLTVTEYIQDGEGADSTLLIVLGDVRCRNLITLSAIYITGNLHVENAVLGDSLCNYSLLVGGDLKARVLLNGGHTFESLGTTTADYIMISNGNVYDKTDELKANLGDGNLMYDLQQNPGLYKGQSFVELIDALQDNYHYDLPLTVEFIKQGGTVFHKR